MTGPRILLKMPNWVGDCVMATPAIEHLRMAFPTATIDALVRPGVAPVLEANPHLTAVLPVDSRRADADFIEQLKRSRYDAVVLLTNSFRSAWFAWRLGVNKRIGYARSGRNLLLSHALTFKRREWQTPAPRPLSRKSIRGEHDEPPIPGHMVEFYLRIARTAITTLDGKAPSSLPLLQLRPTPDADARVQQLLVQHGLAGKRLVGLNPGAAYGGAKRWPAERLAQLAGLLTAPDIEFVSTASPAESSLTELVQQNTSLRIHPLGEHLDLAGLIALVARLDLLITSDSGPMHIGAALQTPTVAIFGPTDWNVTSPFGAEAQLVRKSPPCAPCFLRECPIDHRCMQAITSEEVAAAASALLSAAGKNGQERRQL